VHPFCGVPGNSILDALSCVRDVLAHAEVTGTPLCTLTLNFKQAYDSISHRYLFYILRRYGISQWFAERIHALYDQAKTSAQINGSLVGRIPIQRCKAGMPTQCDPLRPMSAPPSANIKGWIPNIRIEKHIQHSPIMAYTDDVTVFVTRPEDFVKIQQAVHIYERDTGGSLNPGKLRALAVGPWEGPTPTLGIAFHDRVEILRVEFGHTIARSTKDSWTRVIGAVRAQARQTYARRLCLVQRMQYIQLCLLAKI
jgi:hypothetical protein